ncbi:hypothetical protein [Desulfatitalea tepidiphila]|uniref:hypothetical protein n=1 Tax=Desulfatitalea tepidiphila TaxID=1185843 RepID=UPI0013791D5A|nr:hypothetical protein [Desulfatitalea tepidiphila]
MEELKFKVESIKFKVKESCRLQRQGSRHSARSKLQATGKWCIGLSGKAAAFLKPQA